MECNLVPGILLMAVTMCFSWNAVYDGLIHGICQMFQGRREKNGYFTVRLTVSVYPPPPPHPPPEFSQPFVNFFCVFFILEYVIICEADFTQEKSHFHPTSSIPNSFWRPPLRCEIPEFAILPLKTHKFCWEYLSILALLQSYYYKCWGCSAVYIFGKNWRK